MRRSMNVQSDKREVRVSSNKHTFRDEKTRVFGRSRATICFVFSKTVQNTTYVYDGQVDTRLYCKISPWFASKPCVCVCGSSITIIMTYYKRTAFDTYTYYNNEWNPNALKKSINNNGIMIRFFLLVIASRVRSLFYCTRTLLKVVHRNRDRADVSGSRIYYTTGLYNDSNTSGTNLRHNSQLLTFRIFVVHELSAAEFMFHVHVRTA